MQTERQAVADGLLNQSSSWEMFETINFGGTHITVGTFTLWAAPPTNQAAAVRLAADQFPGAPLATATTTKGQGVLNAPIAALSALWVFNAAADATGDTIALNLLSADAGNHNVVTTALLAATNNSTLNKGWNNVALTVPAERQWSRDGTLVNSVMLLYPGDVIQLVVGTAQLPGTTCIFLDIQ